MDPILLTPREAAAMLNISRSHLYEQFLTPGRLPVVRIGRSVRILSSALERLVRELAEGGETE